MKDIILKITGKTISSLPKDAAQTGDDPIEFVTEGKMAINGDKRLISYEETPLSGMPGCVTWLTIEPGKMRLQRSGDMADDTVMEFEQGKRYNGLYETPYGSIDMEILTNSVEYTEDRYEGKCSINYAISLRGLMEARKVLDIEIRSRQ